ncbi:MAG: sensor histidine kinase [Anaerolineae bacterium]
MAQVLGNLVTNALRYTPVGGTITLRASSHPQGVQLAVSDTGSGIAEEHIANIFERFYRTESSRYQGDGDTESGLGLAIAKSIVEAHHGTISVESKLGVGSTFRIILPRADK